MRNLLKKWLGITALEKRAEAAEDHAYRLSKVIDKKVEELNSLTREDWDIGVRASCTVVLTGVYRGRGYVQFYDVPADEFSHLVEMFGERRKHHLIRTVDAPPIMSAAFDIR